MLQHRDVPRQVFDGFCHRPFREDTDGWMCSQYKPDDFAAVRQANDVLEMFHELNRLAKENWELKRELKRNKMEFWSDATPNG